MTRLEYIALFKQNYLLFVDTLKSYSYNSSSPYSYASGNRINPLVDVLLEGVKVSKFDSSTYANRSVLALSCYNNYFYVEFNGYYDTASGKYKLKAHKSDFHVSTGDIYSSSVSQTSSVFLRFGGSYINSPMEFNQSSLSELNILYDNTNGRGLYSVIDYYPSSTIKYYVDTDVPAGNNTGGNFNYYGKAGLDGNTFTNSYGINTFYNAGNSKFQTTSTIVSLSEYDNVILPVDAPLWNPSGSFYEWLVNDFCNDYEFWNLGEEFDFAYPAGIVSSASQFYEYLTEKYNNLVEEENVIVNTVPISIEERDLVDFFGLKSSFDKSFDEYPGIFSSVRIGFGYVDTDDSSPDAISTLNNGYKHISNVESLFNSLKLKAINNAFIKSVEFSDLTSLCTIHNSYQSSYSISDIDGNTSTFNFNVDVYRLDAVKFASARIELRVIAMNVFFGVTMDYDIPCGSDATALMIAAFVALVLGHPEEAIWIAAAAGTITAILIVTAWIFSLLLVMNIGGRDEQRVMRAYLIVFAIYNAYNMVQSTATTSSTVASNAAKSGMYDVGSFGGKLYVLTPTVKAYAYSAMSFMSGVVGGIALYSDYENDGYNVDESDREEMPEENDLIKFEFLSKTGFMFDPDKKINDRFDRFNFDKKINIERNINGKFV